MIQRQFYPLNGLIYGQALIGRAHRLVPNKLNGIAVTQDGRFNLSTARHWRPVGTDLVFNIKLCQCI